MHSSGNSDLTDRTEPSHPDIVEKALALADAIVSSAGGEFSVSTAPLSIVADFPVHRETAIGANDNTKLSGLCQYASGIKFTRIVQEVDSETSRAPVSLSKRGCFPEAYEHRTHARM